MARKDTFTFWTTRKTRCFWPRRQKPLAASKSPRSIGMKIETLEAVAELQGPAAVVVVEAVVVEELAQEAEAEQAVAQAQAPAAGAVEAALVVVEEEEEEAVVAEAGARAEPTAWNKNWRKLAA